MRSSDLSATELKRLYGPWAGKTPADVALLMADYPGPWWVSGGWAMEAFTGVARPHDDIDLEVLRVDLPLLRRHLRGRLDLWSAVDGALCPLLPGDQPDAGPDAVLPEGCGQVWTRAGGAEPWEYDVLLMAGDRQTWEFKRDRRIQRPLASVGWTHSGVPFLRPEIQLLLKARGRRPKDQSDFDTTLPLLDPPSAAWLRDSLSLTQPVHPWLADLSPSRGS